MGLSIKNFRPEFFLSQSQKNRGGILYCCSNVGYRKCLDKKGEYQDFPSKNFCLIVPKISVAESFIVSSNSGTEKVWRRGLGEYQQFPSKFFCLRVPKNCLGESLTVALISCSEKVYGQEGEGSIKKLRRKIFVSKCRKTP